MYQKMIIELQTMNVNRNCTSLHHNDKDGSRYLVRARQIVIKM